MKGQFVIIDLRTMDYMKDKDNKIIFYDSHQQAMEICWICEFENAWVLELVDNYVDNFLK